MWVIRSNFEWEGEFSSSVESLVGRNHQPEVQQIIDIRELSWTCLREFKIIDICNKIMKSKLAKKKIVKRKGDLQNLGCKQAYLRETNLFAFSKFVRITLLYIVSILIKSNNIVSYLLWSWFEQQFVYGWVCCHYCQPLSFHLLKKTNLTLWHSDKVFHWQLLRTSLPFSKASP